MIQVRTSEDAELIRRQRFGLFIALALAREHYEVWERMQVLWTEKQTHETTCIAVSYNERFMSEVTGDCPSKTHHRRVVGKLLFPLKFLTVSGQTLTLALVGVEVRVSDNVLCLGEGTCGKYKANWAQARRSPVSRQQCFESFGKLVSGRLVSLGLL